MSIFSQIFVKKTDGTVINPATMEKQLPDNHQVTVSNQLTNYATSANQTNKEQISKIFNSWGNEIGCTLLDQLMTAEPHRVAGGVFNGTSPDNRIYTTTLVTGGTAAITNSILDIATTATSGSSSLVYTNSKARYIGGNMNHFRCTMRHSDGGQTNNIRQVGLFDSSTMNNAIFFQLSGTTFSIIAKTSGQSDTIINSGNFNGDVSSYDVSDTNFHNLEILVTNKRLLFYIDKVFVHELTETNSVICGTRHLSPFVKNYNTGTSTISHLYIQSLNVSTWGNIKTQPLYYLQQGLTSGVLLKNGIGSLHMLNLSGVINTSVISLYDGTSTAGSLIYTTGAMSNQTEPSSIQFNDGIQFNNGLFMTITGAASNCQVIYE